MPSPVLLEGKVAVCMTTPNKHTSSLDGANMVSLERRWVVLKREKLKVYDKKRNVNRKKLLNVALTADIKGRADIYVENSETKELYFAFPDKVCVFRFSQADLYSKWSLVCRDVFFPHPDNSFGSPDSTSQPPSARNSTISNPSSNTPLNPNINYINLNNLNSNGTTSPRSTVNELVLGNPTLTSSTNWGMRPGSIHPTPATPQDNGLDLATTNDPALLKQEILMLRKKAAHFLEERENLLAILAMEKEFVRDRQNKLDSWEHFARIVVFKAVCNQSKNEKLQVRLNKIFSKNLPTTKSIKITRMEVVLVNLPTRFDQCPNFGLTNYNEEEAIATFKFEWFPQNCTCILQIDGYKYLGGAIPISFKVSIDLLSKLKIRGELLLSKGEGNQFLMSLPRLPDLTFASPSKLQIGDIFDVSSFTVVQKVVEAAVFNTMKKNLLQPKWKEVHF